jgi:hypothetical protein
MAERNWIECLKLGLEILKSNPWDASTLTSIASAMRKLGYFESEMLYLKGALLGNPDDPQVNRLCAIALQERMQFDQAMAYWHRVEEARPDDVEPKRAIFFIQAQKLRGQMKIGDEDYLPQSLPGISQQNDSNAPRSPEEILLDAIAVNPNDISLYLKLSEYYADKSEFAKYENALAEAYKISGGDADIKEKWHDAKLRNLRYKIIKTTDKNQKNKLQHMYILQELEYYKSKCSRYPLNYSLRYDLGIRYLQINKYEDAIRELQIARNDPFRKIPALLALGPCFQYLRRYSLALTNFEQAVADVSDGDMENKKESLRKAGKIALIMNDLDKAEKYLNASAMLDYSYKDVPNLLELLAKRKCVRLIDVGKTDETVVHLFK